MQFRTWLSIITVAAIILIVVLSRHEIATAWQLLGQVNLALVAAIIAAQLLSFIAVGNTIFEYLKSKGDLRGVSRWQTIRMSLELNFVNHALPTGGVSGFSYMGWRLNHMGVSAGRATMAQVIRHVLGFFAFLILLLLSVVVITLDGSVTRFAVLISTLLACGIIFGSLFLIYILGSKARMRGFSATVYTFFHRTWTKFTKTRPLPLTHLQINEFFDDLHDDYQAIKSEKRVLVKPFGWAVVVMLSEIAMFLFAFQAIGVSINPAIIVIAYGVATIGGLVALTPGGAGVYELLMVGVLRSAGAPGDAAIAAILMARVIQLIITIFTGYVFYQLALMRYGKRPTTS